MAEARSAVTEPRVKDLEEGKDATSDFFRAWRKSILRRFFRTRNSIRNGLWPTSIWNLAVAWVVFSILLIGDWHWAKPVTSRLLAIGNFLHIHDGIPFIIRVLLVGTLGSFTFFILLMYKRRWLLRVLLSYRGWMYEPPRVQSWKTLVWGFVVRLVSGYHPTMSSYQKSLPFLPVPEVSETLKGFLKSIEPLYDRDSEEFQRFQQQAKDFEKDLAPKLQRILVLKSWWAQNWVTDWWEKYVYLMGRTPIAINSNYYVLDHNNWKPTSHQVSRAASTIFQYVIVKKLIDREQLRPLVIRNTIPLCMGQYERLFSTTRIPGEDYDELVKYDSKHIMVMRKGMYYKLDLFDAEDNPLTPQSLEKQLEWIVQDADVHSDEYSEAARSLSSLTGIERTSWARTRQEFFSSGVNKDSLDILESAVFHVVLDTNEFSSWSNRGKYLLHGDGRSLWFDKSFNLVVFADGKQGLNAEHSWGDAPVLGHMSEFNLTNEVYNNYCSTTYGGFRVPGSKSKRLSLAADVMPQFRSLVEECRRLTGICHEQCVHRAMEHETLFDENGRCIAMSDARQAAVRTPQRLVWDVPAELTTRVERAVTFNQENNDDLDLVIKEYKAYGKGFIKTCKVSPDAYVQLALQLTFYKDFGKFALTYESSMTRLYLLGRTETVRSLTNESTAFVRAMEDKAYTNEECIDLLRKACEHHQLLYKDAMNGKGIDRHMFGLLVVAKGLGYDNEFLRSALMMPWTLSTSQQPQQQIPESPDCNNPEFKDKICPGGGFGPVSDKGYGVSYMIPGEKRLFFHVSSKKSSPGTNSEHFMDLLFESLDDMNQLFTATTPNGTTKN